MSFRWSDQGGNENLGVNGAPRPTYAGELLSAPASISGALIASGSTPIPGGRKGRTAVLRPGSGIDRVRVGGQEFALDDVCFK